MVAFDPYLLPDALSIQDAAAEPGAQLFLLMGKALLLPLILGYTGYVYWMFRGRVRPGAGYH